MTKPTQAQIEAAAKVLYVRQGGDLNAWGVVDEAVRVSFKLVAAAALAAAARDDWMHGPTIERCAQVADRLFAPGVAEEIRKLKDGA